MIKIIPLRPSLQSRVSSHSSFPTFIYSKIVSPVCQTFTHSRVIKQFCLVGTCRKAQLVYISNLFSRNFGKQWQQCLVRVSFLCELHCGISATNLLSCDLYLTQLRIIYGLDIQSEENYATKTLKAKINRKCRDVWFYDRYHGPSQWISDQEECH